MSLQMLISLDIIFNNISTKAYNGTIRRMFSYFALSESFTIIETINEASHCFHLLISIINKTSNLVLGKKIFFCQVTQFISHFLKSSDI